MSKQQVKKEVVTDVPKSTKSGGKIYTYVGKGEDSPQVINFIGKQKFVRGKATAVEDKEVLSKLGEGEKTHPCFVEGEVDPEVLFDNDLAAKQAAEAARKRDAKIDSAAKRIYKKWAGGESGDE